MLTTETTETTTPKLPPVECAPWCRDGNGHTDEHFPADQFCESAEEHRIGLSAERSDAGLEVYADRAAFSTRTIVHVCRNGRGDQDVRLTVAEARHLGEALLSLVRTVEGDTESVDLGEEQRRAFAYGLEQGRAEGFKAGHESGHACTLHQKRQA